MEGIKQIVEEKKTLATNSSGLEMTMLLVELEFFWQRNGGGRCLRWSVSQKKEHSHSYDRWQDSVCVCMCVCTSNKP